MTTDNTESGPEKTTSAKATPTKLTKKDFETSNEVRWCPGCGDYSILATIQKVLPSLGIPREKYVFVSGIGCSSRFPYYMNTYGFHTIHGRAPAVATGVKLANPDLSVWIITGDGDALSIGGNHFIHLLRRNLDVNVILFNNQIYGLTKGQYSPTSELLKVTKSTPMGSPDYPLNPLMLAIGAQSTFVARSLDVDPNHLSSVLTEASKHRGTSFIELYQNCVIFNDGAFAHLEDRKVRADNELLLEHGKPMIFGKNRDKGIKLTKGRPHIVSFTSEADEAATERAALAAGVEIHDKFDPVRALVLARLHYPEFPVPMGIIYQENRQTFDSVVLGQIEESTQGRKHGTEDLQKVLMGSTTWEVK